MSVSLKEETFLSGFAAGTKNLSLNDANHSDNRAGGWDKISEWICSRDQDKGRPFIN